MVDNGDRRRGRTTLVSISSKARHASRNAKDRATEAWEQARRKADVRAGGGRAHRQGDDRIVAQATHAVGKAKNTVFRLARRVVGKAKEGVGKATGNADLRASGKAHYDEAEVKQILTS